MKTIESMIGRDLQWVQPSFFKQVYELRNSSLIVAKVEMPKLLSYRARVESEDGCWTFDRKGIWRPAIIICECDNEIPVAAFREKLFSNKQPLLLSGGETLIMQSDLFGWTQTLQTESGELLAQVKRQGFFRGTYKVELRRRGTSYKEYPWLVLLLWYLLLLQRKRAHAHAAIG